MKHLAVLLAVLALVSWPGWAAGRPVLLELFTSQGCSSCPPADALLTRWQQSGRDVVTLSFHVDYWNRLGWRDPFSLPESTARQRAYARALNSGVFTPQLVIDGRASAVGSDADAIEAAVAAASRSQRQGPALSVAQARGRLSIAAGPGAGRGVLLLIGYDTLHRTHVGSGENGGAVLTETDIVRSLTQIGTWTGGAMTLAAAPPAGEKALVLLQADDGSVLATASAE